MTVSAAIAARAASAVDALADRLQACGDLADPAIREALHAAPRHLFAPDRGWYAPDGPGERRAVDRHRDFPAWWDAVYGYGSLVTQVEDGAGNPAGGVGEATSSLSSPGAVTAFLELLDVRPGERVLEIGTGTGWTAALLSALGARVTTVEVDPGLAEQARERLQRLGVDVEVLAGDGAAGVEDRPPWDAVHVTCGVTAVPYAWVAQTRPGGRIVFPWMPEYGSGHKAALTVTGDGRAVGRLAGDADYMMLRGQRTGFGDRVQTGRGARESGTRLDPRRVVCDDPGADAVIAGLLPDVMAAPRTGGGRFELLLGDAGGVSWARCVHGGTGEHRVQQAGPRRLWDEVADAYGRWVAWERPARGRCGMTVSAGGQVVWLDDPDNVLI